MIVRVMVMMTLPEISTDLKTNWITLPACITEANGGHIGGPT